MPKNRVLIDINVLMDVLQKREPFYEASAQVLSLAEDARIEGFISAHAVTTLMYLLAKNRIQFIRESHYHQLASVP